MIQNQGEATAPAAPSAVVTKNKVDVATEVRHRIGKMLTTRSAQQGTLSAKVEEKVKRGGSKLWSVIKKRPIVGVALVSGGAFAVATAVGVGEITLTLIVGYAAYQVFREGVPPKVAAEEALKEI
jgi:hypothetical protein